MSLDLKGVYLKAILKNIPEFNTDIAHIIVDLIPIITDEERDQFIVTSEADSENIKEINNRIERDILIEQEDIEEYLEIDFVEQLLHYIDLCDNRRCLHCESIEYKYNVLDIYDSDL